MKVLKILLLFAVLIMLSGCNDNDEVVLNGNKENVIEVFEEYIDPGVGTPEDFFVEVEGLVDNTNIGEYTLKYSIYNKKGSLVDVLTRNVEVLDTTVPTIEIIENPQLNLGNGFNPTDMYDYFTITDNYYSIDDLVISSNYDEIIGSNDISGYYNLQLKVIDPSGNESYLDYRLFVKLDFFFIINNLNLEENQVTKFEFSEENLGILDGITCEIIFENNDILYINQKGHFRYFMHIDELTNAYITFSGLNISNLEDVFLKLVIGDNNSTIFTSGGTENFDVFEYDSEIDISELVYQYNYIGFETVEEEVFEGYMNYYGLIIINNLKSVYEDMFGLDFNIADEY